MKVYNFEVKDWNTYFISDINVLVHNKAMKYISDYVKNNRVPIDKETVFNNGRFQKTSILKITGGAGILRKERD